MSDQDWRDEPLLPEQTEDDVDRDIRDDERDRDERLREDVPPHHGSY
ncbi:MAG TPA: hypothetical protein VFX15_12290 [Actinomycetes bacterium]|nr:hypothetical protein [Actinomycetes bacterium]